METLTHWRKELPNDYIGAYMMPTDGSDITLTIKKVAMEKVTGNDGSKKDCLVASFKENVKPMILNRTNAKTITKVYGTPYIEQWSGKQIQIYTAKVQAWGEQTDALRIRDFKPANKGVDVSEAIAALNATASLAELQAAYMALSKTEQAHPDVIKLKDTLKTTLS
jgi:hypothetical protein